jgi:hypothetical protein
MTYKTARMAKARRGGYLDVTLLTAHLNNWKYIDDGSVEQVRTEKQIKRKV